MFTGFEFDRPRSMETAGSERGFGVCGVLAQID
jgi:hypothetical protein